MQPGFKGAPPVESLFLSYELPECPREDGAPFRIGKQMAISHFEKANLSQHVTALRGNALTRDEQEGFQVQSLLGKACNIIVTHTMKDNGDTVAKIQSVAQHTGKVPKPVTELAFLDFENQDQTILDSLPAWLQAIVAQGKPYPKSKAQIAAEEAERAAVAESEADIPF